jgi:hypothetical protein
MSPLTAKFSTVSSDLLSHGYRVRFRATGRSMLPTIHDGDGIVVESIDSGAIRTGDILLYRSPRGLLAHRVVEISRDASFVKRSSSPQSDASRFTLHDSPFAPHCFITRGDASRSSDDPVQPDQIIGRVVAVERQGILNPLTVVRELIRYRVREQVRRLRRSVAGCLRP